MKKIIITITLYTVLYSFSYGQEFGLSTMSNLWQTSINNPATISNSKFVLSLPSIGVNASTGNFTYNNIIGRNQAGETVIDANKIINASKDKNSIGADLSAEMFAIAFGSKKWQFHVSSRIRSQVQTTIPKNLLEVGLKGNEQFIGETVNIAPNINSLAFAEIALGFTWKVKKLALGLRAKPLIGIASINTQNNTINLTTSDKHHLNLSTDYVINSGGAVQIVRKGENIEDGFDIKTSDLENRDYPSGNRGFAVDLGATYDINEKLTVGGSIIDLGSINWKTAVTNQTTKGDYQFKGLNISDIVEDEDANFDAIQDSIISALDFKETTNSFKTGLTAKTFWTIQYKITKNFNVGGLINTTHYKGNFVPGFAVNGGVKLGNILSLGTVISYSSTTKFAVGGNMLLTLGPLQIFSIIDNLTFNNISNNNYIHARTGVNLVIGRKDKKKKEEKSLLN